MKEKALKTSSLKSVEKLEKHTKLQQPLFVGDKVLIQNQAGRFATKWEKTGRVVETHANDQYTIKVDGSGRLTLHNRQFLRKAAEHNLYGKPNQGIKIYPKPSMGTPLLDTGSASQPTPSAPRIAAPPPPTIPDPDIESNDERPACVSKEVELPWEVDMPEGAVQDEDECQPWP